MNRNLNINESFICKIWEGNQRFYSDLKTYDGKDVNVLHFGIRNFDAGPDYRNAKVMIGNKLYTGDVEVHRDFDSWVAHKHKGDNNYNSVILQVILWDKGSSSEPVVKKKRNIPTVILSHFLKYSLKDIWQEIIFNPELKFKLPCFDYNSTVSSNDFKTFLSKLSLERLNLRTKRVKERLQELIFSDTGNSRTDLYLNKSKYWNQVFYEFMFESLGFSKNKEPMLKLSQNLSLKSISKYLSCININPLFTIHALLFGSSGLLDEIKFRSGYQFELKDLWISLMKRYNINRLIDKNEWKFFRLRPSNFPTIRLAYGSQLIFRMLFSELFKKTVLAFMDSEFDLKKTERFIKKLYESEDDKFWNFKYKFSNNSMKYHKLIGTSRIDEMITNAVIPMIFLYANLFQLEKLKMNVLKYYINHKISSTNSILNIMDEQLLSQKGIIAKTPAIEQAVIQLYNFYCLRKKCDDCDVGGGFVREKGYDYRIIFY